MKAAPLLLLLGGCLIIPEIPHYRSSDPMRQNVEKATDDGFPIVGVTTREEVLLRLGEPDGPPAHDDVFVYRWVMEVASIVVMNQSSEVTALYGLTVRFDARGRVASVER